MTYKLVINLAIAAAAALTAPLSYAGKKDDTLRVASNVVPPSIDSYFNGAREGVVLAHHIWSFLATRNERTGEYEPELATGWKWIDNKTLEVDLRKDVKFHNGDRFSADDVVYTLNWVIKPENKVVVQQNISWIEGADKLGDYKVRIRTKTPFPAALEYLAGAVPIYPAKYYAQVGPNGMSDKPIGSGPYRVTEVVAGKLVRMEKFNDYFKGSPKGTPSIGKIEFRLVPEQATQLAEIMSGGLDWIWRVPADQAESLKAAPNLTVLSGETMRVGFVSINNNGSTPEAAPFKDVRVRQAVNHAINRKALADSLVRGGSQAVHSPCFRTQFGCDTAKVATYEYNPAKAKALLAEAGYANGFDTDLWAYRERDYAEAIIGDLRKVGIRARLHFVQYPALRTELRSGRAPLSFQAWGSFGVNDASAFAGNFFKGGPDDTAKDPQVIALLQTADSSVDKAERKAKYAQALQRISTQAMWAPMFSYSTNYAFTSDLKFDAQPDELPRFYQASWK